MTAIFILINLLIGIITIYLEIKNRERNDKIFYTFYMVGMCVIITPFLGIIDSVGIFVFFTILYTILLYGLYTDFEFFTVFQEAFLSKKQIKKEKIVKIDYALLNFTKSFIRSLSKLYSIKTYNISDLIFDEILISIGIVTLGVLLIKIIL